MSDAKAMMSLVERWARYYNDDAARMVEECYAADCTVYPMGLGVIEGRAHLHKVEAAVLAKAPRRRLEVLRSHVAGDTVCVECELRDPERGDDWSVPFIAVLSVRDGQVVTDRTYADWSRWPGL